MYIKNNRLYDNGVSFEIPKDVRVTVGHNDEIIFFRDNEFWCIVVYPNDGQFDVKVIGRHIATIYENDNINTLQSDEKTVNDVFMHRIFYSNADVPDYCHCVYLLNNREEADCWHHCEINIGIYDYDPASGKSIEDYPIIKEFINSVRKEPQEEERVLPACVIEMLHSRNHARIWEKRGD